MLLYSYYDCCQSVRCGGELHFTNIYYFSGQFAVHLRLIVHLVGILIFLCAARLSPSIFFSFYMTMSR
jgi:hypothetical protein